jgi:hypothetical protein
VRIISPLAMFLYPQKSQAFKWPRKFDQPQTIIYRRLPEHMKAALSMEFAMPDRNTYGSDSRKSADQKSAVQLHKEFIPSELASQSSCASHMKKTGRPDRHVK